MTDTCPPPSAGTSPSSGPAPPGSPPYAPPPPVADHVPDPVLAALAPTQAGRQLALDDVSPLVDGACLVRALTGLTLDGLVHQARARLADGARLGPVSASEPDR